MPASRNTGTHVEQITPLRHHIRWPHTPDEQSVPEAFESVGEGVLERILDPVRRSVPLLARDRERNLGTLYPGACFKGHQNAAEESKHYPVEVMIQVSVFVEVYLFEFII